MNRRIKIWTRRVRKLFRKYSKQNKMALGLVGIICCGLLCIFLVRFIQSSQDEAVFTSFITKSETPNSEGNTVKKLIGKGFVASIGSAGYSWLYGANTLQFDDVWTLLVEHERSLYTSLNIKEQLQWEKDIMNKFEWETLPSTISEEDTVLLGLECGFTESETKEIIKEIAMR